MQGAVNGLLAVGDPTGGAEARHHLVHASRSPNEFLTCHYQ